MNPKKSTSSRRNFIKSAGVVSAGFIIVPRHVLGGPGFLAPSDKLLVAGIGVGGKGRSDLARFYESGKADIAYLCDVDDRQSKDSREKFPKAKYYKDWREMFDKESKNFDAVSVSTPDHNHAVQAMSAMQLGKHVYVQKPLTHDIYEARKLTEAADDKDFKLYQLLFKELGKEPVERLPSDFSAKITARLQGQKDRANERKFYILIAVIAFAGFSGAYIMLAVMNYEYASQLVVTIFDHGLIFLFCLICFLIIEYLDQKLVKPYQC